MTTATETARTGTEVARWLLPLLKEYTDKLNSVCDRLEQFGHIPSNDSLSKARVLAMRATLHRFLLEYARQASSLLDHLEFDGDAIMKAELTNRWHEAEMAIRTSDVLDTVAERYLARDKDHGRQVRNLIDHIQSGELLE